MAQKVSELMTSVERDERSALADMSVQAPNT
jgi:hypothetical protein